MGLGPWEVFHQGIAQLTGLQLGTVSILLGIPILAAWWPLGERPGVGTLLNIAIIGTATNVAMDVIPDIAGQPQQLLAMLLGVVTIAVGSGLYLASDLGPGPRDGLMTGLHYRFGWSIRRARTAIELTVLCVGFLAGRHGRPRDGRVRARDRAARPGDAADLRPRGPGLEAPAGRDGGARRRRASSAGDRYRVQSGGRRRGRSTIDVRDDDDDERRDQAGHREEHVHVHVVDRAGDREPGGRLDAVGTQPGEQIGPQARRRAGVVHEIARRRWRRRTGSASARTCGRSSWTCRSPRCRAPRWTLPSVVRALPALLDVDDRPPVIVLEEDDPPDEHDVGLGEARRDGRAGPGTRRRRGPRDGIEAGSGPRVQEPQTERGQAPSALTAAAARGQHPRHLAAASRRGHPSQERDLRIRLSTATATNSRVR